MTVEGCGLDRKVGASARGRAWPRPGGGHRNPNLPSESAAANSRELAALEAQSPARHGRSLPSRGLSELRRRHQPLPPRRCPPPSHRHKEAGAKRGERRRRRDTLTSSRCPLPDLRPHPPNPPPAAAPAPNGRRELARAESQAGAADSHRAAEARPGRRARNSLVQRAELNCAVRPCGRRAHQGGPATAGAALAFALFSRRKKKIRPPSAPTPGGQVPRAPAPPGAPLGAALSGGRRRWGRGVM